MVSVPGALEIPLALQWLAQSGRFDALVARRLRDPRRDLPLRGRRQRVGARRDGRGAANSACRSRNGILTTEDEAQAEARLDKGAEAVRVALEMAKLRAEARSEEPLGARRARVALQALYAWQLSGGDPLEEARGLEGFEQGDRAFVEALVRGVRDRVAELAAR